MSSLLYARVGSHGSVDGAGVGLDDGEGVGDVGVLLQGDFPLFSFFLQKNKSF